MVQIASVSVQLPLKEYSSNNSNNSNYSVPEILIKKCVCC